MFSLSAKLDSLEIDAALGQGEEQCHKSIKLHEEKGDLVNAAFMHWTLAEVYISRIHWLLGQPGKVLSATELSTLWGFGIRDLEKRSRSFVQDTRSPHVLAN